MPLTDDWGYQLAQGFLDAAVSCEGVTCENRRIVNWGASPEGCGEGCPCALTVAVLEGLRRTGAGKCEVERTASIELLLDVCRTYPARDGYEDLPAAAGLVRDHATLRWGILRGLRSWWTSGKLCAGGCIEGAPAMMNAGCEYFTPGAWVYVGDVGTCARYRMLWEYKSPLM